MEQRTLLDSGNGLKFTTPCKVLLRRLSSAQTASSSKRSLFKDDADSKDCENTSDIESDLGPMSPLALTDLSSCDSSPGRQFVSPFATPEKSPNKMFGSKWDRLVPGSGIHTPKSSSPFSTLKRITKEARSTPRKNLFTASPKLKQRINDSMRLYETFCSQDVVPETPGKESDAEEHASYIEETPQKDCMIQQLNTPLGSVSKYIPIPRLHRRKSCGTVLDTGNQSPEIKKCTFKRHLEDSLSTSSSKYLKTDDISGAPKARAALFQEKKIDTTLQNTKTEQKSSFTVKTEQFYGSSCPVRMSVGPDRRKPVQISKPRYSLPSKNVTSKRPAKRNRKGEINLGVRHAIKKPKPKRPSLTDVTATKKKIALEEQGDETKENFCPTVKSLIKEKCENEKIVTDVNKKFFKTKVIQTANKKVKLDQADDLTVDEPVIEATADQCKVNSILKALEEDWADDDTENTPNDCYNMSPKKSGIMLKNLTMSPASELSSMASVMNIDDTHDSVADSEVHIVRSEYTNYKEKVPEETDKKKYYPLFTKGYSSDTFETETNSRKRKRNSCTWQLSQKHGKADDQYQIDAGQKLFGATQCKECGIIYYIGDPDDESAHLNYHNSYKILKFQGWKNERIVFEDTFTASRIVLIDPKDSGLHWKKVTEVLEIVDRDLGLSDFKLQFYRDKKIYFYIRDKTILGVLVADQISTAFRMIPDLVELNCCTSESSAVKCGVNVVWTAMSHRRQGIATKLVDTLRANYFYGYIMNLDDIAFSTPTPSGKLFAQSYTKTRNFKVY